MTRERPLEPLSSIKTKLAVLVAVSVLVTAVVALIGDRAGVPVWMTVPVTLGAALGTTTWLARGMTAPLREMTAAASAMAAGDYTREVSTTGGDEVGVLARAFTTMARDLAATDEQRRELLATVSHELRTPLAAQRAVLENLVDGITPPSESTLRAALSQTERLGHLVDDLLDLSRLESGATRLDLDEVDVADLVAAAVGEAGLDGRAVPVAVDVEDGMRVLADRARLTQVLTNLLDNALRHSPDDGVVCVRAGLFPQSPAREMWWLEVVDKGPGIDPAVGDRIFERFSTGGEHGGGTGLGLAIARWVAELHGGRIALVPAEGGARVRVTLPVDPRSEPSGGGGAVLGSGSSTPGSAARPATAAPASITNPHPSIETPQEIAMSTTPQQPQPAPPGPVWPTTDPTPAPAGHRSGPDGDHPGRDGSLYAELWPERASQPQPLLLLGSLGVGALAALLAVERRLGLAAFVVLLLGGALVWRASAYRRARFTVVSAVLATALGVATLWRAAEWLAVISVLVGGVVAATALTRATKVSGIVAAVAAWPLSGLRGLPLLGRTISATSRLGLLWPVLRTAALSVVALVLFGGLFASADAIFGSWTSSIVPDLRWDSIIARAFVFTMVAGITLAGCYLALNPPKVDEVVAPARRSVRRWEWAVPVGLVVALFAGFHLAQASATLRGHDYVRETTGMSYAEYVHQGFAQLTVATMLMLAVVALTLRKAAKERESDRRWLRLMLGTLSLLTLGVVAAALWRMHLYQQAYGFTSLRLFVDGFELWLGLIVLMVLASLVRLSTRWVGRGAVLSAAVLMVVLAGLNPDAWVARHNIERFESTGRLDAAYLATLSDDAVPTIAGSSLPEELRACILHVSPYVYPASVADAREPDHWLELNLGRARADEARSSVALPSAPVACERYYDADVRVVGR
jgi:two-component system, OmpR family, sensor histidine kinase BaeS